MREVLDLYREIVRTGQISSQKLDSAYLRLSLAIDQAVVSNRPSEELQALRNEVLYLKCEILRYE